MTMPDQASKRAAEEIEKHLLSHVRICKDGEESYVELTTSQDEIAAIIERHVIGDPSTNGTALLEHLRHYNEIADELHQ